MFPLESSMLPASIIVYYYGQDLILHQLKFDLCETTSGTTNSYSWKRSKSIFAGSLLLSHLIYIKIFLWRRLQWYSERWWLSSPIKWEPVLNQARQGWPSCEKEHERCRIPATVHAEVGEAGGCQELQHFVAGLLGMGPRREACESCCREKPPSMLHDASYLANAVIVSLKWLSHNAQGEGFALWACEHIIPFPGAWGQSGSAGCAANCCECCSCVGFLILRFGIWNLPVVCLRACNKTYN